MTLMWDRGPEAVTQMWNRQGKKIITVKMFMRMRMIYTNGHANVSQFVGSIYCDALLVFSSIENNSVFL